MGGRVGTERRRRRRRRKRRRRRRNRDTAPQRQCVPEAWKRDHAPGWLRKGESVRRPGTFVLRRVPADRTGSGKFGASRT